MLRVQSGYCHRIPEGSTADNRRMNPGLLQIALLAGLGAAVGIAGGLFGVGGGVIVIPLLGMLYGLDQQVAQGTTLVMVAPNVMLGFWRYRQRIGLDPHHLRIAFAGFLVILAAIVAHVTWRGFLGLAGRSPLAWGWSAIFGA